MLWTKSLSCIMIDMPKLLCKQFNKNPFKESRQIINHHQSLGATRRPRSLWCAVLEAVNMCSGECSTGNLKYYYLLS